MRFYKWTREAIDFKSKVYFTKVGYIKTSFINENHGAKMWNGVISFLFMVSDDRNKLQCTF